MFARFSIALFLALCVGFGLFLLMNSMISNNQPARGSGNDLNLAEFIQLDEPPDQLRTKDRQKPEPPPPPDKPPPPELTVSQEITPQQRQLRMPKIEMSMGVGGGPMLGGIGGGAGAFGGDLIPLVRITPQYPRDAARGKIEGYVKVEFTVLEDGSVTDVDVIDAEPPRTFNRAAVRAILKWKFKPRIVDGKAVKRRATQTLEFNLPDAYK